MAVVGVGVAVVGVGFTPKSLSERVSPEGVFEHFPDADDRSRLRGCGQGFPRGRIRCASPERMKPASAAKIPRGIGAERIGPQGRCGRRSSSPAGAARRCSCHGRAYRSPKSLPGRAPAVKRPSAPGYHPHRLRHGTESPTTEVSPAPLLPPRCFLLGERHSSKRPVPQRGPLFEQAFRFASTVPGKPPTFHPASGPHPSIHTDIHKTARQ